MKPDPLGNKKVADEKGKGKAKEEEKNVARVVLDSVKQKMNASEKVSENSVSAMVIAPGYGWGQLNDWRVSPHHLFQKIITPYDVVADLETKDAQRLTELVDECENYEEIYKIMVVGENWNNAATKASAKNNLKTIIDYCEGGTGSAGVKEKLRYVGRALREDRKRDEKDRQYDTAAILVTLSLHGNVCNVQKEVGVQTVYNLVSETMKHAAEVESLRNRVYILLYSFRELQVEKVYIDHVNKSNLNTHPMTAFRNGLCKVIGIAYIPDEHSTDVALNTTNFGYFRNKYCADNIVEYMSKAFNNLPPKIPRDTVVNFLKENSPSAEEWYEFLEEAYDEDSGQLKEMSIRLILVLFGVLKAPRGFQWTILGEQYCVSKDLKLVKACDYVEEEEEEEEEAIVESAQASSSSGSNDNAIKDNVAQVDRRERVRIRNRERRMKRKAVRRPRPGRGEVVAGVSKELDRKINAFNDGDEEELPWLFEANSELEREEERELVEEDDDINQLMRELMEYKESVEDDEPLAPLFDNEDESEKGKQPEQEHAQEMIELGEAVEELFDIREIEEEIARELGKEQVCEIEAEMERELSLLSSSIGQEEEDVCLMHEIFA